MLRLTVKPGHDCSFIYF
jgi:hypothetical protein